VLPGGHPPDEALTVVGRCPDVRDDIVDGPRLLGGPTVQDRITHAVVAAAIRGGTDRNSSSRCRISRSSLIRILNKPACPLSR
jgi:hypothetical protein